MCLNHQTFCSVLTIIYLTLRIEKLKIKWKIEWKNKITWLGVGAGGAWGECIGECLIIPS